jgi:hypothetical protein
MVDRRTWERGTLLILVLVTRLGIGVRRLGNRVQGLYSRGRPGVLRLRRARAGQNRVESSRSRSQSRVESSWSPSRSRESASRIVGFSAHVFFYHCLFSIYFFIFKRKGGHFKLLFFVK